MLVADILGPDPSVDALGQRVAGRAAGNPFFAEELVRELAERGVLRGEPGAYTSPADVSEVTVPATLQATIAARIDRLQSKGQAHAERGGNHRLAVRPRPTEGVGYRSRR